MNSTATPAATGARGPASAGSTPSASGSWIFTLWAVATLALLIYGVYEGLIAAPTEQTMGNIQRIFYYHVPAAITGFFAFFINFAASAVYLGTRSKKADAVAVAGAEVGLAFLSINLISGPIWAHPVWGIWWTWDARLTLTLVLWLLVASYLLLRQFTQGDTRARLAAALSMFISADAVIDYFAIRWWRTQHPQPVLLGGPNSGLDPRMQFAFLVCWAAFLMLMGGYLWMRYRIQMDRHALEDLRQELLLADNN
jgi:heme exporter protein C